MYYNYYFFLWCQGIKISLKIRYNYTSPNKITKLTLENLNSTWKVKDSGLYLPYTLQLTIRDFDIFSNKNERQLSDNTVL